MAEEYGILQKAIAAQEEWDTKKHNLLLLCGLLYGTGCRISEVLAISDDNIRRLAAGENVRVYISKTNNTRTLFLTPRSKEDIAATLAMFPEGARLLVNMRDKRLTYRTAEKWLSPYFLLLEKSQEISGQKRRLYTSHSFRIGFVTRMLSVFSLPEVSQLVGHASYKTTLVYARRNPNVDYFKEKLANANPA